MFGASSGSYVAGGGCGYRGEAGLGMPDRLFAPRVAILFYGLTTVGMGILCGGSAGTLALIGAFLSGLGMGAEVEVMG